MHIGLREAAVHRVAGSETESFADVLAVEEPLEIRIGIEVGGKVEHRPVSITMRTPGNDHELAAGFLFTEGILRSPDQLKEIKHCGRSEPGAAASGSLPVVDPRPQTNTVRVDLREGIDVDLKKLERHFYTTSSCGVCGKSSIEALSTGAKQVVSEIQIDAEMVYELPRKLLSAQFAFDKSGGLHASALFDADGELEIVREDVGRHNALDKVIGKKFLDEEVPLNDKILMVSGRASFELVQKALMAGIPVLAAVGAPSSLAVELAKEFKMTLIGFVREDRFNIYCGEERIAGQKSLRERVGCSNAEIKDQGNFS